MSTLERDFLCRASDHLLGSFVSDSSSIISTEMVASVFSACGKVNATKCEVPAHPLSLNTVVCHLRRGPIPWPKDIDRQCVQSSIRRLL